MISITEEKFANYDCLKLENKSLELWVTQNVGPRIVGLSLAGGENLLAFLPDVAETTPAGKIYRFRGGHRLWHAPEHPERTYVPDDAPLSVTEIEDGVTLTQPVEDLTGVEKRISIKLATAEPRVEIEHTLTNRGAQKITLAPWAITQLRPGGFAILPQPQADTGLLPNRRLALWPYTPIASPHLQWGDRFIFAHANMEAGKLKIGWANPDGWLAYWVNGTLFVKQHDHQPTAAYYDFGSSAECYCDPRFFELETLGPITTLTPNEAVTHLEMWRLFGDVDLKPEETTVAKMMETLSINNSQA